MSKKDFKLCVNINESNLNHHLWNNNGTWFIHFMIHRENYTAQRIRKSLKTRDVAEARKRRDKGLASLMKED